MAAAVCWAPVVRSLVQDALCGDRGLWVPGKSRSDMRGTRSSVWLGHGGCVPSQMPYTGRRDDVSLALHHSCDSGMGITLTVRSCQRCGCNGLC